MRPSGPLSDQRNAGAVPGAVPAGISAGHALAMVWLFERRPADHGSGNGQRHRVTVAQILAGILRDRGVGRLKTVS
jgi:hypothetical protein